LKVGGFSNPQSAQRPAKGAAQLPQNFMPSGFSNPHFEHDCTSRIYLDFQPVANNGREYGNKWSNLSEQLSQRRDS
jgi:hypothetical protein